MTQNKDNDACSDKQNKTKTNKSSDEQNNTRTTMHPLTNIIKLRQKYPLMNNTKQGQFSSFWHIQNIKKRK